MPQEKLLNLRRLSNTEYDEADKLASLHGIPLTVCPTCGSCPLATDDPDFFDREPNTYRFRGEEYECDCNEQMALRKHYLLARIPDQYMRLNWLDYTGSKEVKGSVALYLDNWEGFRANGMGLEFGGIELGVGKTFGATYVGKELVKRGRQVFFIPFLEVIKLFETEDGETTEKRLRSTEYLILDEVVNYYSERQGSLYAEKFESLIRHRTNWDLPTIMTTNLSEDDLYRYYPRVYSLLSAKQMRIEVTGKDARMGMIREENIELSVNGEVRPIT